MEQTDEDLLRIKNLGVKTLDEIRKVRKIISQVGFSEKIAVQEKKTDRPTFTYKDGAEYYDVAIKELNLSVRAINALEGASVLMLSKLAELSYDEIIDIHNMGKKTAGEIVDFLKSYNFESAEQLECDIDSGENGWLKAICRQLTIAFNKALSTYISSKDANINTLKVMDSAKLCDEFVHAAEEYKACSRHS